MISIRHLSFVFLALYLQQFQSKAFTIQSPSTRACFKRKALIFFATTTSDKEKDEKTAPKENGNSIGIATASEINEEEGRNDEDGEDDDEYEFEEYETLLEKDYLGSEWLVGTCWENKNNNIKETWVRLATKGDKNIAVWGDNSEGSWSFDVASQFLAISKEFLWGKQIWAGVVDDYYFSQGTVRGWTYLTPASVLGQWQAKRLGVDPDEAGTPPWFRVQGEEDDDSEQVTK